MSTYDVGYRLTVFQRRSSSADESAVLTGTGTIHSDDFKVSSIPSSGFLEYLDPEIKGRQGSMDYLKRRTTVGTLVLRVLDKRTIAGGSNLSRWMTEFVGDDNSHDAIGGNKVLVERTINGGDTWTSYFTGRIYRYNLVEALTYQITLRDISEDFKGDLFVSTPHVSATALRPWRLPQAIGTAWGGIAAADPFTGSISYSAVVGGVRQYGVLGFDVDFRRDNFISRDLDSDMQAVVAGREDKFFSRVPMYVPDGVRAHVKITEGARINEEGQFKVSHIGMLSMMGIRWYVTGLEMVVLDDVSDPNYMEIPPDGDDCEIKIVPGDWEPAAKTTPIMIGDLHPAAYIEEILLGYYGRLKLDGSVWKTWAYDATALNALKSDGSLGVGRWKHTKKSKLNDEIESVCQQFNLGYRFNADGEFVLLDMRLPVSSPTSVTITDDELISDSEPVWEHNVESAITRVDAKLYVDAQMKNEEFIGESKPDVPPGRIRTAVSRVLIPDFGSADLPEKVYELDFTGFHSTPGDSHSEVWKAEYDRGRVLKVLEEIRGPYSRGTAVAVLTGVVSAEMDADIGDWRLVAVSKLPDPKTHLRGGTRLMRVIQRIDTAGSVVTLKLLDSGLNTIASAPALGTAAQETGNDKNGVTCSVTLNGQSDPVIVEYIVTTTAIGTRPADNVDGWLHGSRHTANGTSTLRNLPSGKRVWLRARSEPQQTDEPQLPSSWVYSGGAGYVNTGTYSAPTSVLVSSLTGSTGDLTFTTGANAGDLRTWVGLSSPPAGSGTRIAYLKAGNHAMQIRRLELSTSYRVHVRHEDRFGAQTAEATYDFSTTATLPTAPNMLNPPTIILGAVG